MPVIEGDINDVSSNDILKASKLKPLECDVVIGGPPCQSFSLVGRLMGMDDQMHMPLGVGYIVARETFI
jgi:DNA (cytosine-5)-methyltransferase 1